MKGKFLVFSVLVSLVVFVYVLCPLTTKIKVGDTVILSEDTLVEVRNLEPVNHGDVQFSFGDRCIAEKNARIEVIGVDEALHFSESKGGFDGRLLVRLEEAYQTREAYYCPDETIFFFSKSEFVAIPKEQAHRRSTEWNDRNTVKRFLKK